MSNGEYAVTRNRSYAKTVASVSRSNVPVPERRPVEFALNILVPPVLTGKKAVL